MKKGEFVNDINHDEMQSSPSDEVVGRISSKRRRGEGGGTEEQALAETEDETSGEYQRPAKKTQHTRNRSKQRVAVRKEGSRTEELSQKEKQIVVNEEPQPVVEEDESEEEERPIKTKKKKKSMKSEATIGSRGGSRRGKTNELSKKEKQRLLEEGIEEAKAEFEKEKERILRETPDKYKEAFGQIGFSKWGKLTLPVLIVSPFDVPPVPVRQQWLDMFESVKRQGRSQSASWLVYWYGTVDLTICYSLVPSTSITLYDAAKRKGLHEAPKQLKKKVLTKAEKDQLRGYEEMLEDLDKDPSKRRRGVVDFKENYELLTLSDVEELEFELVDAGESDAEEDEETPRKSPPRKRKAKKDLSRTKRFPKNAKPTISSGGVEGLEGIDAAPTDPAKHVTVVAVQEQGSSKDTDSSRDVNEDVEGAQIEPTKPATIGTVGSFEDFGDAESKSDDDERDTDYVDEKERNNQGPKDSKPSKRKSKPAKDIKPVKEKTLKDRERKAFRNCEENYYPLLVHWREAMASKDASKLSVALDKVEAEVNEFSATFIETYEIPDLLKQSKTVLKDTDADPAVISKLGRVRLAFKTTFEEKKKALPPKFTMKKSVANAEMEGARTEKVSKKTAMDKDLVEQLDNDSQRGEVERNGSSKEANRVRDLTKSPQKEVPDSEPGHPKVELSIPKRKGPESPFRPATGKVSGQAASQTQSLATERKTFRLTGFTGQSKREPGQGLTSDSTKRVSAAAPQTAACGVTRLPGWMTGKFETTEVVSHEQRVLGLEFLAEMSALFPAKTVNPDSIARSIEDAIFKEATKQAGNWLNPYWKKIHAIVTAMSGKFQPGGLFHRVLAGEFESAEALIKLKIQDLGRAVQANP